MSKLKYYLDGKLCSLNVVHLPTTGPATSDGLADRDRGRFPQNPGPFVGKALEDQKDRLAARFHHVCESELMCVPADGHGTLIIPTETIVLSGATAAEVDWLRRTYGMQVVQEGRRGKVLMQLPEGGPNAIQQAFEIAQEVFERGNCDAAHPNFLRVVQRPAPSAGSSKRNWGIDNPGSPGLVGADVHGLAAWTITEGDPDIRIAVLDEGVDTLHPWLRDAVVDEADFVDDNSHAQPDGDDAHGTACAGIICSRHSVTRGLAPNTSLVAVRIAKGDRVGNWIFDDFDTADAIDWAWEDARSDVLSNSWGGGPPVDVITRAFERARTRGRKGKGCVLVVAAGNAQAPVDYPGNLSQVLTVGASNPWDERKTRTSQDGESWWGSGYGDSLDLLAPGVSIATTDIRGKRGYSDSLYTGTFNGTSAATPHVAAAAGLILSIKPALHEKIVRKIINETADKLSVASWNKLEGHGRLNVYAALRAARRL